MYMTKNFKKIFLFLYFSSFVCNNLFAAPTAITIDSEVTGNYEVYDIDENTGEYVLITEGGKVSGNITNSTAYPYNPGHVDISNYNGEYDTKKNNTQIGTSDSYLDYVLASGSNTTLTISNPLYANRIALENSIINLNDSTANIQSFQIHNGVLDKQAGSTVNINVNYNDKNTTFGFWQDTLDKNMSIEKLNIADGKSLTLKNYAFADNVQLGNNSQIIITSDRDNSTDGVIRGNVFGTGLVVIDRDYNEFDTVFGSQGNSLSVLDVNSGYTLTLEAAEGYQNIAYIDELALDNNATLKLGNNSQLNGNIIGANNNIGNVIIDTNYNYANTNFGALNNKLSTLTINENSSLTLGTNKAYIDIIKLSNASSSLILETDSKVDGIITGAGSVNINTDYDSIGLYNTYFGTNTDNLQTLNINNSTLDLGNKAYVANLNLNGGSSALNINDGSGIDGTISGTGTVDLNIDYSTLNTDDTSIYNNTIFGTETTSLAELNINNGKMLTLGNTAYVDTLNLEDENTVLNLENAGILNGNIIGSGTANINANYSTIDNATSFGNSTTNLSTLNIKENTNLTLGNDAYVNKINLNDNSTLNLNDSSNIYGTIRGVGNNDSVNINTNFIGNNATYFGESGNSISNVNIASGASLSLQTNTYVDKFNMAASNSRSMGNISTLSFIANNGNLTINNSNGIAYNSNTSMPVLITLKNTSGNPNNEYINQLYDVSKRLNASDLGDLNIQNNNIYVNVIDKQSAVGTQFLIDSSGNPTSFAESAVAYEGLYKDLKLKTQYNSTTGATDLYLVVNDDRTPTLNDISQSALTSANVLNNLSFANRTQEQNALITNLQNISGKQEFFHALNELAPDSSGLNLQAPAQSIISAVANINKRLSYFRRMKFDSLTNNYNMSNLSRNDVKYYDDYFIKPYNENNVWIEGFIGNLHQDTKDNIFGYDADYYGGTIGYDVRVTPNFIFGASYTFNQIKANNLDNIKANRDDLDVITNNADLYFMLYNRLNYLTLNIGGGYSNYEQKRKIRFSNFDKTAKADYNGYSYHAGIEYGINFMLYNPLLENNDEPVNLRIINEVTGRTDRTRTINKQYNGRQIGRIRNFVMLTPKVSLTYGNIVVDDYTEKNADSANLNIKTKDYDYLDLNAGLDLTLSKGLTANTSLQTILNASINYGIINNKVELDARYVDTNETFKVYGFEPNDFTYNVGLTFNFSFYEKVDLGFSYNYLFADSFDGMEGRITLLWAF